MPLRASSRAKRLISGYFARKASRSSAVSSALRAGMEKFAVRWNTVRWLAASAIMGTDWIADDPVPITPTRRPVKSIVFGRPGPGVIALALEIGEALDIWHPRIRQASGGEHDMFCRDGFAVGGGDLP